MNQTNYDGENFSVKTGKNNTNFFGGIHYHNSSFRRSATGIPYNLPYSGVTKFVGRDDDLKQLHEQLQAGSTIAISAISGMGGIGKTELALQYAYKHLEVQTYPGGVCWLRARQEIGTQIVSFAQTQLEITLPDELELLEKVAICWRQWCDGDVLVVFDDVQSYAEVEPFLPPTRSRFKVLLTTRLKLQPPVQNFEIRVLSEAKAIELLRAIVPDGRIYQDLATAMQIGHWLGYLPLGIELVGRYLARKPDTSLETLWQRLQDKRLDAQALKKAAPEMTAELEVAAAFELSWQELNESAQQLAVLLSLFALAEIPWSLVEACHLEEYAEEIEDVRDESLLNLHLLERTGQGMYQLHQLLREFFAAKREQMAEATVMRQSFCQAMVAVAEQIPQTPTLSLLEQITPTIPHLKEAATTFTSSLTDADLITPSTRIAWFYEGQAAYAEAEEWYEQCRASATQRMGTDHPAVAASFNNLAYIYYVQGRYAEAETLYTRALDIRERQLGADHPAVATSLNNLAELYRAQGRYIEAEPLYTRALGIYERQLGNDHSTVAISLNNLANLYYVQGRYAEAEPLYTRALGIRERQLGADHPAVAGGFNNLAALYCVQGRYAEAEPLYTRALDIWECQLGADHPAVAASLSNLAGLYQAQGRNAEAEALYTRALDIRERQLGSDHPDVAISLSNLAGLYEAQGRNAEAEPLFTRALDISERQLGNDHPTVATSLNNLAGLYEAQGRNAEAEPLFTRALDIRERQLGNDHPDVATSLNNLAELYRAQGRYAEAEPLYLRGLAILFEQLGDDHPNTQTGRQNFLLFLQQVMQAGETGQLSDNPMAQDLLRQMKKGSGE